LDDDLDPALPGLFVFACKKNAQGTIHRAVRAVPMFPFVRNELECVSNRLHQEVPV
jgi:hypothetical protein